jgi:methylthioribose-1-phosphate isomerase
VREHLPVPVSWRNGAVRVLDQRALPHTVKYVECRTVDEVCNAITSLAVRGAPAIGAAGAYGVALAAAQTSSSASVHAAAARLERARPTAVNLAWAVRRTLDAYDEGGADGALDAADAIAADDVAANEAIGRNGLTVIPEHDGGARVLTHCNAGHLATAGYGTAIGVIRAGYDAGRVQHVWIDETRPVLQGARLTAWELHELGIPSTLVVDAAAASLMAAGDVDMVVVGADRIAANGDTANKIGTYGLAVLAKHHDIPFVVAAPWSTVDLATPDGRAITVETRDPDEVTHVGGTRVAPNGVAAHNPAFDVTPAALISAIVTEHGVARRPLAKSLPALARR